MPRAFGLRSVSQTFTVAHRCLDFLGSAADAGAAMTRASAQAQSGRIRRITGGRVIGVMEGRSCGVVGAWG